MPDATALTVLVPGAGPRVQAALERPPASVLEVEGVTLPPPVPITQVTATPGTALFCASRTSTISGWGSSVLTGPVWLFPAMIETPDAAPAVAVCTNVTGEPASPSTAAKARCVPAVLPKVRVTDVSPSAPVAVVLALTLPPP